ncbi:ATP-binding protein [Ramlibacter sp.]|uniref:ATP-binding protein n=1 Tax=Ramlibacter sp. TaxID=1917967 RepID=UPI003D141FB3
MRLRIVHQLSLLFAAVALLSTAAIGGFVAWNLRTGFSDYLRSRDLQQLERFAQVVADRVDWRGEAPERLPMRELMDEFMHRDGRAPPPDWRPPPRGPGPGPGRGGNDLPQRIQVVDTQGQRLGGPPFAPGIDFLEQPVRVAGAVVASVRMLPSEQLQAVDARFLRRQYTGLAGALAAMLALGCLAAALAARWLGAPLRDVQGAAHRIARGELDVVVPVTGSREMAELIGDVNRMAASLKTLEGSRRRWIAQISHELRTPLSVLLGEIEAVQDGAREPTPQLVASLRDEVLQLVRLVNDLHTLSMADLGALPCAFAEGEAGAALRRALQRLEARVTQAGLSLEILGGEALQVAWDFGRIEQLVTNLVENSIRYTHAPGTVRVQWRATGGELLLTVDDTPPGVAPADLPLLFEPLHRVDRARQRATGGSGLGLAICKAIVQAHGGSISASASALGGLRIEVRTSM